MFYIAYHTDRLNILWYRVITLDGYEQSVINLLKFDSSGRIVEGYDMQGLHILSVTLTWDPYFTLYDCKKDQNKCSSKGYLTEIMNLLGDRMNFTWESHEEKHNNWGTTPISGPSNSSGTWGGVVGEIFKGNYQLSIR